jgi:hypothetical protein
MRPARIWIALWTVLGLTLASGQIGGPPRASSRPYTPLTVSIAGAEVIAAVRVLSVPVSASSGGSPARVEASLLRTFKGSPAGLWLTLVLAPFQGDLVHRLVPGREYVVFLAPASAPGEYRLTDPTLLPYDESQASRLDGVVSLVPAWSDASAGLASIAVPDHDPSIAEGRDPFRYRVGEPVLLWSGYRNVSSRNIVLRYRDWPLDSHTCWHLRMERVGAGAVESLAHPHVDMNQIRDFFSRNPHRFEQTLRPGEMFFLYLDRINVAEPGWGYKERLDFRYYPMAIPGEYTMSAVGRFFHPGVPVTSRVLRVWVD